MPKATVPEEVLVKVFEPSMASSAPGAMPRKPELVRAATVPLLPTAKIPSMVQLPADPLTNVAPAWLVVASRVPLALVVSKPPLLVKVPALLMMRVPPARTSDPSFVTDAAVETVALPMMV